jgi:SAM-dependent methyltransferase
VTNESRFDEIASVYDAQIPAHVRLYLLRRKTDMMIARLGYLDRARAVGLDLGCGTGWHVKQLHEHGFARVFGLDNSPAQLAEARRRAAAHLCLSDVRCLPYVTASIDFAYAINVIHHLKHRAEQQAALTEINRILRPGGLFFLHEINVTNPLIALYMDHLFPRLKSIDNGTENWVLPESLPHLPGFELLEIEHFTFVPDFTPRPVFPFIRWLEERLETVGLGRWGAHYMATLRKVDPV